MRWINIKDTLFWNNKKLSPSININTYSEWYTTRWLTHPAGNNFFFFLRTTLYLRCSHLVLGFSYFCILFYFPPCPPLSSSWKATRGYGEGQIIDFFWPMNRLTPESCIYAFRIVWPSCARIWTKMQVFWS